ncbi:MAG: NAD-dependent epimerase/dehydratase family protein [Armatimonadota bacterium]
MNILVTGGAGFIASHIVDAYIEKDHKVVVIDNLSSGKLKNLNTNAQLFQMDIGDERVEDIFAEYKFDIVNHHAAQIDVRKSVEYPVTDADTNILSGIKILELCRKYEVKKIIYASTGGAIYGEPQYLPCDEKHPVRPLAPYGISKHCLEHYIEYFHDMYKLDYTILRYANVYGPRQDPHGEAGVVAIFTGKLLEEKSPFIFGDGEQTRDYVYVGDVVNANTEALAKAGGEIINIGTGEETSVTRLFYKIADALNSDIKPVYKDARAGEVYKIALDNNYAGKVLGWKVSVSLEEGLRKTADYFKEEKKK